MKKVAQLFEQFLRKRDLRFTRQRQEILRVMYGTHAHVSADDLYEMLQRDARSRALRISRATVYRTLSLLAEGGFVEALDLGRDKGVLYEHTLGHEHHDHMICLDCGRIYEFSDDALERAQDRAVRREGFQASSHRLNVFGTCARCARKAAGKDASKDGGKDGGKDGAADG